MNKINIKEILGNNNDSQKKGLLVEKNEIEKKINQKIIYLKECMKI